MFQKFKRLEGSDQGEADKRLHQVRRLDVPISAKR